VVADCMYSYFTNVPWFLRPVLFFLSDFTCRAILLERVYSEGDLILSGVLFEVFSSARICTSQ
jgi:hypothetical protein